MVDLWLDGLEKKESLNETDVSESTLTIPDIRNKLTPITTLIAMIERGEIELASQAIEQCKISINYLAQREVFFRNEA